MFVVPIYQGVGFGVFAPGVDGVTPLGASANRWLAVYATNGTIQTSDSAQKDHVPLLYGMTEILQINTIKYKWKSQADLPDSDPAKNFEYYGFCANELKLLLPELVYDEDASLPVQMNYSELLPVVVNALKEEHATVVALQTALATTQSQLNSLLAWAQLQGYSAP
jgi:hypothetical protein